MPRKRGTPKTGGRHQGSTNKTTAEVRTAATLLVSDERYRVNLQKRLIEGKAPHMETLLWHYAYGKPVEQVRVDAETRGPMGPVTFIVRWRETASGIGGARRLALPASREVQ